jgi:DNA-binding NarL/FixJ family response regulator
MLETCKLCLTPREEQVVRLISEGISNRETAAHMRLSENTIKKYLSKIFRKLELSNRVELVLYVMSQREANFR